jgi:NRAMP (natural resistance-associated macrophage protein)-like metal ion transporter
MKKLGPGLFIAAAFIGPGTITTASQVGALYGFQLVWALLFSVVATVLFQNMAAKFGLVTGQDLASMMRQGIPNPILKAITSLLVFCAIGIGNAAYQAGNMTGAALGVQEAVGGSFAIWISVIGFCAAVLLLSGKYAIIQLAMTLFVGLMSLAFVFTAVVQFEYIVPLLKGFLPSLPTGSELLTIGLIGTTIVPYNLFLHSALVNQNKDSEDSLNDALAHHKKDTILSISIGGLVTLAIISTSATAFFYHQHPFNTQNISQQLTPVLGESASLLFAIGLFSAGMTSAITAPLATAYAISGILGWQSDIRQWRFKCIWSAVLIIGGILAISGTKPLAVIILAQTTNGILLPLIAIFLLYMMNQKSLLGEHVNGKMANIAGLLIVLIVVSLAVIKLNSG